MGRDSSFEKICELPKWWNCWRWWIARYGVWRQILIFGPQKWCSNHPRSVGEYQLRITSPGTAVDMLQSRFTSSLENIGGHSVCYPWSAISDWALYKYRTEPDIDIGLKSAESDIISDIGINFCPISDIRLPKFENSGSAVVRRQILNMKTEGSRPVR
jgi:hypothetical protein